MVGHEESIDQFKPNGSGNIDEGFNIEFGLDEGLNVEVGLDESVNFEDEFDGES